MSGVAVERLVSHDPVRLLFATEFVPILEMVAAEFEGTVNVLKQSGEQYENRFGLKATVPDDGQLVQISVNDTDYSRFWKKVKSLTRSQYDDKRE